MRPTFLLEGKTKNEIDAMNCQELNGYFRQLAEEGPEKIKNLNYTYTTPAVKFNPKYKKVPTLADLCLKKLSQVNQNKSENKNSGNPTQNSVKKSSGSFSMSMLMTSNSKSKLNFNSQSLSKIGKLNQTSSQNTQKNVKHQTIYEKLSKLMQVQSQSQLDHLIENYFICERCHNINFDWRNILATFRFSIPLKDLSHEVTFTAGSDHLWCYGHVCCEGNG